MSANRVNLRCMCINTILAAVLLGNAGRAQAQLLHGGALATGCGPKCVGDVLDCTASFSYNDGFQDAVKLVETTASVMNPGGPTPVPVVITHTVGNAVCSAGLTLPCFIGPGGSFLNGLPGDPNPGSVFVQADTYQVQAGDGPVLFTTFTFIQQDQCNGTVFDPGCPTFEQPLSIAAGTPVTGCNDGVNCTKDSCAYDVNGIPFCTFADNDLNCDDGLFCNGPETCDPINDCQPGTPPDCNDLVDCTKDACNEATNQCDNVNTDSNCDDGLFCNGLETCDPINDCQPGTPPDCDDLVVCTKDACNETTNSCDHVDTDSNCNDGLFCNGVETCDPINDCQPGTPPNCDDGVVCTKDACNEATDSCDNVDTDSNCDDGLFCNGVETCDPINDCQPGTPPDCDDLVDCTKDACNEATDSCDNVDTDSNCDDGLFCNGVETCDPLNDCQPGIPVNCSDGVDCTKDACNEDTDSCDNVATDSNCDDGQACTVDICDPVLDCVFNSIEVGDCCTAHDNPGCDSGASQNPNCCEAVCAIDPFCCDVTWDGICAGEAEAAGCCEVLDCRVTGGGNDSYQGNKYTHGGQAGSPDGDHGEWTHHQKSGPDHRFVFHAGTSSSPDETEIHIVTCSDPGFCNPARPAPAKQIDFEGVGAFKNIHGFNPPVGEAIAGGTFHWFHVHIEDLGEPGSGNPEPKADCPDEGSFGQIADCGCPDFYEITIYANYDPATESPNTSDVIYHVHGYLNGGNHQIHPPHD